MAPMRRQPRASYVLVAGVWFLIGACSSGSSSGSSVLPAPVATGATTAEKAAPVVPDDSGIPGVVAYDSKALSHDHPAGPVTYGETPPVGGAPNPVWTEL